MKLEKLKAEHPLPKGLDDVLWLGIPHPKEQLATLRMCRITPKHMRHLYDNHKDGELPVGVPQYCAIETVDDGEKVLLIYPTLANDVEIVGEYTERKAL